jgi:hypothetical protein
MVTHRSDQLGRRYRIDTIIFVGIVIKRVGKVGHFGQYTDLFETIARAYINRRKLFHFKQPAVSLRLLFGIIATCVARARTTACIHS